MIPQVMESSKDFWCPILTRQFRSAGCALWRLLTMNLMCSLEPLISTSDGFKKEQHKQSGSSLMEGSRTQTCGHHVWSSRNCYMVGVSADALTLGSESISVTFDALGHKENFDRIEYVSKSSIRGWGNSSITTLVEDLALGSTTQSKWLGAAWHPSSRESDALSDFIALQSCAHNINI